jgi:hypothetical protein
MVQADHRRNGEAARDYGGVRGSSAEIGGETADLQALELDGVGG